MLLTLSVNSLRAHLDSAKPKLGILDVPRFAREELGLHGLNVQTSFLTGWGLDKIDRLRDEADKAGCPCLILIETDPQGLGNADASVGEASVERMDRVLRCAHRLGCSGVALTVHESTPPGAVDAVAERLRRVVTRAERLELNLLLIPHAGLTAKPDDLTGLIRKVGGFRIGSFPDFQTASATGDPNSYLRSLTPYASAVCASSVAFDKTGEHTSYDLKKCVQAISSVGYDGTVSLEYRGKGDATAALLNTRAVIEAVLESAPPPEDE